MGRGASIVGVVAGDSHSRRMVLVTEKTTTFTSSHLTYRPLAYPLIKPGISLYHGPTNYCVTPFLE